MSARLYTLSDYHRRRCRRERAIRYGGALVAVVLPALLAWVAVSWWLS